MELRTIRDGPRLVPATQHDLELLLGLPERAKPLRTRVTLDRSSKLHRWYWSLLNLVAEGIDLPVKVLHVTLKAKAGLVDGIVAGPQGAQLIIQSTAHDLMGDDEFRPYVHRAVDIIFRDYLDGSQRADVLRRVNEMVDAGR